MRDALLYHKAENQTNHDLKLSRSPRHIPITLLFVRKTATGYHTVMRKLQTRSAAGQAFGTRVSLGGSKRAVQRHIAAST